MRVLIIDDHSITRFGIRQLVEKRWPDAIVDEADTLSRALARAREVPPDIALVDLSLPDTSGVEGLVQMRRACPGLRLLVLSMHDEIAYASRALKLGAAGYLTKEHATDELVQAMEKVIAGTRYISSNLATHMADMLSGQRSSDAPHDALSPQEYRVMLLIAAGRSTGEIAELMHLSVKTVGTYRSRIIDKTGLANTAEIARYCAARALLDQG